MGITQPVRWSFTIADELGTEASLPIYGKVDPGQTVGDLLAFLTTLETGVSSLSDGHIVSERVEIIATPGVSTAAAAGSRVEQTAVLNMLPASVPRRYGISIPAFKDSLILNGKVDTTPLGPVETFLGTIASATVAQEYATSQFISLAAALLADAILTFRKKRRQLSRSSFER